MKQIKELIKKLGDKIKWIRDNEDINYDGDTQDFRNGVIEGIELTILRLEELIKLGDKSE